MAAAGLDPATSGLKVQRSTIELRRPLLMLLTLATRKYQPVHRDAHSDTGEQFALPMSKHRRCPYLKPY